MNPWNIHLCVHCLVNHAMNSWAHESFTRSSTKSSSTCVSSHPVSSESSIKHHPMNHPQDHPPNHPTSSVCKPWSQFLIKNWLQRKGKVIFYILLSPTLFCNISLVHLNNHKPSPADWKSKEEVIISIRRRHRKHLLQVIVWALQGGESPTGEGFILTILFDDLLQILDMLLLSEGCLEAASCEVCLSAKIILLYFDNYFCVYIFLWKW